jgi:hypothetical protein
VVEKNKMSWFNHFPNDIAYVISVFYVKNILSTRALKCKMPWFNHFPNNIVYVISVFYVKNIPSTRALKCNLDKVSKEGNVVGLLFDYMYSDIYSLNKGSNPLSVMIRFLLTKSRS